MMRNLIHIFESRESTDDDTHRTVDLARLIVDVLPDDHRAWFAYLQHFCRTALQQSIVFGRSIEHLQLEVHACRQRLLKGGFASINRDDQQAKVIVNHLNDWEKHFLANFKERRVAQLGDQVWPKHRDPSGKMPVYRVGQVLKHQKYSYVCVITGWDLNCTMPMRWQEQMGIEKLTSRAEQPFYSVLANDGSIRYVAQENLITVSQVDQCQEREFSSLKQHPEIGRFFTNFDGECQYHLTTACQSIYPDL